MADAGARPVLVHDVGGPGHGLHAAGDDDIGGAGLQRIMGHGGGLEARAAHLVDGGGLDVLAEARAERGLTGRSLAEAGGQDAAHEDLIDLGRIDLGAFDSGLDGLGAEVGGLHAGEDALEAAHRGAGEGDDDDGIGSLGHGRHPPGNFGGDIGAPAVRVTTSGGQISLRRWRARARGVPSTPQQAQSSIDQPRP